MSPPLPSNSRPPGAPLTRFHRPTWPFHRPTWPFHRPTWPFGRFMGSFSGPRGASRPIARLAARLGSSRLSLHSAPLILVCALAISCGSSVSIETSGNGGTGGSTATGGASTGGSSTGGVTMGGASTGGATMGGGGSGGATAGGGGAGGDPVCAGLGDPCTECLSTGCADIYCGCSAEIHCGGYLQCLGTCMMGDAACAQNCATVHEAGISVAILTADCAATTCDADCQFGKALSPCQKCLYTSCAPEMNACLADPECLGLIQCTQACAPGDMACSQACVQAHPDGLASAQAVGTCRKIQCADSCP